MKHIIHFDLGEGELLEFLWEEDGDPPPLVKARIKKERKMLPEIEVIKRMISFLIRVVKKKRKKEAKVPKGKVILMR